MWSEWQFGQWVVVALQTDGGRMANVGDYLDAVAGLADAEAASGEYLLVALGMQFGEALAEFEFVAVNHDGAVGAFFALHGVRG